jgi:hypothetical protein
MFRKACAYAVAKSAVTAIDGDAARSGMLFLGTNQTNFNANFDPV